MKVKKKILSLLLAIAMILGMLPMTAMPVYAADATQIKVWNGTEMQTYTLGADVLPTGLFWNSADNRLELNNYSGGRIEQATSGDELTFYVVDDSTIDGGEETALRYSKPTIDGVAGKTLTLTGIKKDVMSIAGSCTIKNITVKVDQKGTVMPNGYTIATSGNINVRENGRLEVELNKETENSFPARAVNNLSLYNNGSASITVTANNASTTDAYGVSSLYLYGTGDCDIQVTNNGTGETKAVQSGPPTVPSHYVVTGDWDSPSVKYTTTNFSVIVQNDGGGTGSASPANAGAGTEITLTANSKPGKQFKEWQVISGSVTITDNKFTMPNEDVIIKAIFEDKTYSISVLVAGTTDCIASANPAEAPAGTEITLTATPGSGKQFKEWQVLSGSVTITDNKFTMPASDVTIKAIFKDIKVTGVSLDQSTLSLTAGGATKTLKATVTPVNAANRNVTWSSSNETVATVANGVVTPLSAGTATITVKTEDGNFEATCTVTVAPVTVTGITVKTAPSKVSYTAGEALDLSGLVVTLTKSDSNTEDVAFADFGTKGITASPANGKTLAITDTTVTLTHTASGKTVTQSITVNPAPVTVTGITVKTAPSKVSYTAGEALDLSGLVVTLTKSDSNTEEVAFADFGAKGITASPANGTTLAITDTTVTLTHTASGKTATQSITVTAAPVTVTGISLNKTDLFLAVGNSETLSATVAPADATNKAVTWTSSNTGVATVDENGKVTAVAAGTATITAKTVDGGFEATSEVQVATAFYTVTFDSDGGTAVPPATVAVGEKVVKPADPKKAGFVLQEWQSGSTAYDFNTAVMGDITLKAIWTAAPQIKVWDGSEMQTYTLGADVLPTGLFWNSADNRLELNNYSGGRIERANDTDELTFYVVNDSIIDGGGESALLYNNTTIDGVAGKNLTLKGTKETVMFILGTCNIKNITVKVEQSSTGETYNNIFAISGSIHVREKGKLDVIVDMKNNSSKSASGATSIFLHDNGSANIQVTADNYSKDAFGVLNLYLEGAGDCDITVSNTGSGATRAVRDEPTIPAHYDVTGAWNNPSVSYKARDAETNADLKALDVETYGITPAFVSSVISYNLTTELGYGEDKINIKATTYVEGASLTINGETATSGVYKEVQLNVGVNEIPIVVTAKDGSTTKTYTLKVTRKSGGSYNLVVINGSKNPNTDTVEAGTTVTISADVAPVGKLFDKWTEKLDGVTFANAENPTTTFIMPTGNVEVTANYKIDQDKDTVLESIALTAHTSSGGTRELNLTPSFAGETRDYTVTAALTDLKMHFNLKARQAGQTVTATVDGENLTVNNSADGLQTAVHTLTKAKTVFVFTVKSKDNTTEGTYTVTVNRGTGTIYALTVNNGTADNYTPAAGDMVTITAKAPGEHETFDRWTGTELVIFNDANSAITTFIMPEKALTVTANYKTDPDKNTALNKIAAYVATYDNNYVFKALDPVFDAGTREYVLNLLTDIDKIKFDLEPKRAGQTITATANGADFTVHTIPYNYTDPFDISINAKTVFIFTVKSKDGSTEGAYTVTVYRAGAIYAITVENDGGGTASASQEKAVKNAEITLTATPNEGKQFKEWQVVSGGVTISGNKFTMPASDVTIKAIFKDIKVTGVSLDQSTLSLTAGGATKTLKATVTPVNAANRNVTWSSSNETVATVANGVVTPLSAGTATITVTTVDGSKTATCTVTVTAAPVTVTGITVKTAPSKVSYTAGEALDLSGMEVTLAKSDTTTEEVAFADFGTKGITASPANGTSLATTDTTVTLTHTASGKTATQTITVNPALVTVTGISIKTVPSKVNYTAGEALDLSGLVVTLTKSDSNTEDVAFADFGTKGITASPANGTTLATTDTTVTLTHTASGKTTSQSITVNPAPDTTPPVIYGVMDRNVVKDTTVDVLSGVTATDDVDGAVTVTASPSTIDTSTLGTTTVTYTATDTAGNTATTTATFTVVESAVPVTGVTLDKATLDLTAGGATGTLVATVAPANATNKNVTWSSSDTSIATVVNGAVTPLSTGTATITVKTEDGNFEATCTVTVAAVTYAVTLETDGNGTASASPATAEAGAEITLTASPSSGYVFKKWQVVSGSVTISGNKFTMPAENVTVKAIFEEASIPITITSVTVSPSSTSVEKGGTQTFTAIVSGTGAYDNTVTWSVYGGVAGTTIDYSGILTVDIAETAETLTVNAESNGDSGKKGTATVTITDTAVIKYTLTVNNGSGSGEYAVGDTVNIYAGSRSGYTFNGWTSSDVTITNASNKNASFTMPAKAVTVTANWSYSGGGGGGGSSSTSTIQPTVPAANGSIQANYTASGGTAVLTLPGSKVDEIIARSKDGEVDIDLSKMGGVTSAELPKTALTAINEAGLDVTVKFPAGSITLNKDAAASVAGQAEGSRLKLELKQVAPASLTGKQKEAVKSSDLVLDINISSGAKKISSFDGTLSVMVSYNGPQPVAVWYLNDKGDLEKLSCTFKDGAVSFDLDHLSLCSGTGYRGTRLGKPIH